MKIAQMVSHGGCLFVVSTRGEMFERVRNEQIFAPAPAAYFWRPVDPPKDSEDMPAKAPA